MILKLSVAILLFLGLMSSCSDEISLTTSGDPIPIVYAILDVSDSTHYVKIGKSFAEEASVENQLTESLLFYPNPVVLLHEKSSGNEFELHKTLELIKQPGFFPQNPNPVYHLDQLLNPGEYVLRIKPDAETDWIEEKIILFDDLKVYYPGKSTKRIYFYDDPLTFMWSSSKHVSTYEIAFTLEYDEVNIESTISNKKISYSRSVNTEELEWMQDRWKFRMYSDPFFGKIGQLISEDPMVEYRKPTQLIVKISAADFELNQFMEQNNPDTRVEINYTGNLTNAIGIVAAKYTISMDNLQFSSRAVDSLRTGRFTKNLKFVNNPDW